MANLRADNLTGTGGRNAMKGSVYFSGYVDGSSADWLQIHDNLDDFDIGTGDFTFECWVKGAESSGEYAGIFGMYNYNAAGILIQISNTGVIRLVAPSAGIDQSGSTVIIPQDGKMGSWHHIAVARSGSTLKAFVNGNEEISHSYSSAINFAYGGSATIGITDRANYPGDYDLKGYISNLRLIKGTALYTSAFTPSTEELTAVDGTVLLCCQDNDDPTAEATGRHEITGFRKCYQGKRYSNIATNGDLETGDTTGWTNSGCSTFEVSTEVVHSGTYSLHCVSDGNGDYVYTTASVKSDLRYKVSAWINCVGPTGTSAKAKMKLDHSSAGASQLYESQTVDAGSGWRYVEWIGLAQSSTMYITFNESSANNVNDWYVDDLKVELWYPEEGENILPNPGFLTGATGWSFSSTPSGEYTISSNRLNVADTSRTNDAYATVQLFVTAMKEGKYKVTIDYVLTSDDFDIGIGNNRIFGVAGGGTYSGAGNSASVTYEIEAGSTNSSMRLVANQHCVGYFNNITLSRVAEPKRINPVPPLGIDEGVTFEGDTKVNSPGVMYFPTGDTSQRGRGRGVLGGGAPFVSPNVINAMQYIEVQSGGIFQDFGDLTVARGYFPAGQNASSTRGLSSGGWTGSGNDTIDYITIATTSNAINFGDTSVARPSAAVSNQTRSLTAGDAAALGDTIDYVTIATLGDAQDFGNLTEGRGNLAGVSSPTRGVFGGGRNNTPSSNTLKNTMEYVTIATTGHAQNFGDLSAIRYGATGFSSAVRGIFAGGYLAPGQTKTIDYFTIATLGDASDFGDLSINNGYCASVTNSIRGAVTINDAPNYYNTLEYITIATTGNASDFGDSDPTGSGKGQGDFPSCMSDSHGGTT